MVGRVLLSLAVLPLLFQACGSAGPAGDSVEKQLKKMTLREKIGQLFIVRPEAFDPEIQWTTGEDLVPYAIRSVNSIDAMTADWTRIPYDVLARMSNRIINEVRGINRVVYDISSKPPATIEWE